MRGTPNHIVHGPYDADPLGIPWGAVALWQTALFVIAIAAVAQRGAQPLVWAILAPILTITPALHYLFSGRRSLPPAVTAAPSLIAAVAMLVWSHPVAFDIAPLIFVFGVGAVAARHSLAIGAGTAAVFAAVLIGAAITHRINGVLLYLCLLLMGLVVGHMVTMQRRLVLLERQAIEGLLERATGEERRRIAHEIHDVVAHSLSVTLLYLTGARRELQHNGEINEIVNGLVDAERLGRQAMADIRRTIGLLETGPTSWTPEPGIGDIATLIEDFRNAGLELKYRIDGEYEHISPNIGLGVYRICQESLSNIVEYCPTAKAEIALHISHSSICVSISNDITKKRRRTARARSGAGLRKMTQRAELLGGQLTAGPQGSTWTVKAKIPISDDQSGV